jgi:hypothetical protein
MWFQETQDSRGARQLWQQLGKLGIEPTLVTCDRDAVGRKAPTAQLIVLFLPRIHALTIEVRMRLHQLVWRAIPMRKLACGKQVGDR